MSVDETAIGAPTAPWLRRSLLAGLAAVLSACATADDPPANADWLLGEWQGGVEGQNLAVTSIEPENGMARGTWAGAPVTIIVDGSKLRFVTGDGLAVHLAYTREATLIGTIDRAPWRPQARAPMAYLALQRLT